MKDIIFEIFNEQVSDKLTLFSEIDENHNNKSNLIESFINEMYSRFRIKIEEWLPNKKEYPNYMLLGGDRGILAYVKFVTIIKNLDLSTSLLSSDYNEIVKMISKSDSDLDRPTFLVYLISCNDSKTIFFETNEEIKDRIYTDDSCIDKRKQLYLPDLSTIGSLSNLIAIFKDLKKNSVKIY
ncbi:hypothetical protein [Paracholeplasma manati]|uniref:hypothetical protein n=1 Tax=Paracholeplasma manati TaxID=591373 RepID=UPI002407D730|nr:hypothetical protein [Paracholeplasma manati]MDG0889239.1 hypothetical protein [Paracholeplasma manati]